MSENRDGPEPPESQKMRKRIGLSGVFAICTGAMFSSGFFLLPGLAADEVGPALPLAYLLAGLAVLPALFCMAELASAMPRAGGPYYFISRGLGPLAGTIGGVGYYVQLLLKGAFAFVGVGAYLSLVVEVPIRPVALVLIAVFTGVNLIGVGQTARIELALVSVLLLVLGYFVIGGGVEVLRNPGDLGERLTPLLPGGVEGILAAVALVFVSYGGVGQVGSVAEEVREPGRTIHRGMLFSLATATTFYVLGTLIMLALVSPETLRQDVTPVALAAREFTVLPLPTLVVVTAALAAFLSTGNAAILSAARYPVAMARDRLVWQRLARLDESGTPRLAILVTGGVLAALILALDVRAIATLASSFLLFIFGALCVVVIVMRESRLEEYRPSFRSPLYPWLPIGGIVVAVGLIAVSGLEAVVAILIISAAAWIWFQVSVRHRTNPSGAIYRLFERMAHSAHEDDPETVDLGVSRVHHASMDDLVARAVVVELEDGDFDAAVRCAADVLSERVGVERDGLADRLAAEARPWTDQIADGVALVPLLLEGIEQPEMVLVRSREGVVRHGHELHALLVVVDDSDQGARMLRTLSRLTPLVQDAPFVRAWRTAEEPEQLKKALRIGVRTITVLIAEGAPSLELAGTPLRDLDLPSDCLVALVWRHDEPIVPGGDTSLEPGDRVTFIGRADAVEELRGRYRPSLI